MTVAELIEKLKAFPPEMRVWAKQYTGDLCVPQASLHGVRGYGDSAYVAGDRGASDYRQELVIE